MLRRVFQSKLIGLLIISLLSLLFVSDATAQLKERRVEELDVQGNRRLSDEEILKHIKTRPGQQFDEKQLQQDLQAILALGAFDKTRSRILTEPGMRGGTHVIFEVQELPLIAKLDFGCLRYVTEKEIITELREQKIEIEPEAVYDLNKMVKARRVISEYLGKWGLAEATVTISETEISATSVGVEFIIKELPTDDEEDCYCCKP